MTFQLRIYRWLCRAYPLPIGRTVFANCLFWLLRIPAYADFSFNYGRMRQVPLYNWPRGYRELFIYGTMDKGETLLWQRIIQQGDHVIDVGANLGYFTLLPAALVGKEGKVLAVEAVAGTYNRLQQNIQASGYQQVIAVNVAASEQPGTLSFNVYEDDPFSGNSSMSVRPDKTVQRTETVEATTLKKLIETHQINPKLIKIDVEGADWLVLKGLGDYLVNHSPVLSVEYNVEACRGLGYHPSAIITWMETYGYQPFLCTEEGALAPFVRPANIPEEGWIPMVWFLKKEQLEGLI